MNPATEELGVGRSDTDGTLLVSISNICGEGRSFKTVQGEPMDPSGLSHEFHKLTKEAGLEGVHFHDLRHTFVSITLKQRAKPKVISEAPGHASVGFTMDVCADIIDGMQEEAMALLNDALTAGASQPDYADSTRLSESSTLTGV